VPSKPVSCCFLIHQRAPRTHRYSSLTSQEARSSIKSL
jgi:hypothetical protein